MSTEATTVEVVKVTLTAIAALNVDPQVTQAGALLPCLVRAVAPSLALQVVDPESALAVMATLDQKVMAAVMTLAEAVASNLLALELVAVHLVYQLCQHWELLACQCLRRIC